MIDDIQYDSVISEFDLGVISSGTPEGFVFDVYAVYGTTASVEISHIL